MRFQNLRIAVGAGIVLFLFVAANIISIGLVKQKLSPQAELSQVDVKKQQEVSELLAIQQPAVVQPAAKPVEKVAAPAESKPAVENVSPPSVPVVRQAEPVSQPVEVVRHKAVRTRAS